MANSDRMTSTAGTCEWYTPKGIMWRVHQVWGSPLDGSNIDLDPSSCDEANEVVRAKKFYSINDDGLSREWYGNVWLNPPYGKGEIDKWIEKLVYSNAKQWICLVNNATETRWAQMLMSNSSIICFPDKRIKFWNPNTPNSKSPTQGQMICGSYGIDTIRFINYFENFGVLLVSEI